MDSGKLNVNGNLSGKTYDSLVTNDVLNAFRIAIGDSISVQKMQDGIVDEYEDQTGIDTGNCVNIYYDTTNDCYSLGEGDSTTIDTMEYSSHAEAQETYKTNGYETSSYTKLLLHLNGSDGATSTTDSSGVSRTITFNGTAQLDTAQYKFGTSSLLLDGDSDYLSIADSSDWDLDTGAMTLECWARFVALPIASAVDFINHGLELSNSLGEWNFALRESSGSYQLELYIRQASAWYTYVSGTFSLSINTWYHFAVSRDSSGNLRAFVNGTQQGSTGSSTDTMTTSTSMSLTVGAGGADSPARYFNGWIDEVRISKGVARYTSNFSVATAEHYLDDNDMTLGAYSEDTIKEQGSYSLKLIADATNSLYKRVQKTFSTVVNLSNRGVWKLKARSTRSGSNFQVKLYDTIDSYTSLLLHFNGSNGQTDIQDWSYSPKTVTVYGTAQLNTTNKKFGSSSLYLDGNSDYIKFSDSTSLNMNSTEDFTIDFWFRALDYTNRQMFLGRYVSESDYCQMAFRETAGSNDITLWNTASYKLNSGFVISDSNWHHVAVVRTSQTVKIALDGTFSATTLSMPVAVNIGASSSNYISLGARNSNETINNFFNGAIDEFRISKGIARWTTDFSVPTREYSVITQDVTISSANTWETKEVDLSAYANSEKDEIKYQEIVITNADSANIIYIDDEYGYTTATGLTLQSQAFEAETEPTEARIVILEEDVSAITINTDLKAFISLDSGSNWEEVTLTDEGDFDSSKRILVASKTLTDRNDQTMKYKIVSYNSKNLKLHGTGLFWR